MTHAPKPSTSVTREPDPAVAAFDNAPEEPLTAEELAAIQGAMARPGPAISSEELLARLHPKS